MLRALTLLLLTACAGPSSSTCQEVRTSIELDEPSAYGFSAQEVLAFAEGRHQTTLATRAGDTTLIIDVQRRRDSAEWSERAPLPSEVRGASTDGYAEPICDDELAVPVWIDFTTADGQLRERWSLDLTSSDPESASFSTSLDARRLQGSLELDLDGYDEPRLHVSGAFDAEHHPTGSLRMTARRSQDGERVSWILGAWPAR